MRFSAFLQQEGGRLVIHYLDDFLQASWLAISVNKLEGLCGCACHSLWIGSRSMEICLPSSKLGELLNQRLGRWSCTRRELVSLVGKLAHVCKVVSLGKTVLHRMFEPLSGAQQPCHHLWSNVAFWLDLMWWAPFLKAWNGVSLLQKFGPSQVANHNLA